MKCLYLLSSDQIGGGNRSMLTLWEAATRLGIEPIAVCPRPGPMVELTRTSGFHCEILEYRDLSRRNPLGTWLNHRAWKKVITRFEPELVHANCVYSARVITRTCHRLRLPLVCHVRFPPDQACLNWVFKGLPTPGTFIFNSHALRDEVWPELSRLYPGCREVVVHNAVDLDTFTPSEPPEPGPFRVGIVGNFMPVKGHEDFLRMAAEIRSRGRDVEYWVVGDDIHGTKRRELLEEMTRALGLEDAVSFLGHQLDVPGLLQKLHVLVCPSLEEPFGRVLIEAMACGRPVVASRVGGIPEIVEHGENGFLVEAGDYHSMADHIVHLMDERAELRRLGSRAYELVKERFSMVRHAERILEIYREVLGAEGHATRSEAERVPELRS